MDSEIVSTYLAWDMAEGGDETVSFLANKLREEKTERVQQRIIFVLRAMATKGKLRGRRDVAELVNRTVENMRGDFIKRLLGGEQTTLEIYRGFATEIEANALSG